MWVVQCLTLCNPLDCDPAGSSVHGILQARIQEWEPFPSPGDLLEPGIEPASLASLALAGTFFTPVPKSLSDLPVNHSGCNLRMSHLPTRKGKSDSTSSSLSIYQRGNRWREEKRLTGGFSLTPRLLWLSSEPSRAGTPWSPSNVFKWMIKLKRLIPWDVAISPQVLKGTPGGGRAGEREIKIETVLERNWWAWELVWAADKCGEEIHQASFFTTYTSHHQWLSVSSPHCEMLLWFLVLVFIFLILASVENRTLFSFPLAVKSMSCNHGFTCFW